MAQRKSARPAFADTADKEPSYRHTAFADWLNDNTGYEVDVKSVQLAVSLANTFRQTPEHAAAEQSYKDRRDAEAAARKAAQADKVRAQADKLKAKAAELEAKAAEIAPAKKAPAAKAAKKTVAAPAKKVAAPAAPSAPDEVAAKRAAKKAPAKKAPAKAAAPSPAVINVEDPDDVF